MLPMFTNVFSCLPIFTHVISVYLFSPTYLCLPLLFMLFNLCVPMFGSVYLCLHYVNSCFPVSVYVMFTHSYSCLPMFTVVYMFTHVYSCLPIFTLI